MILWRGRIPCWVAGQAVNLMAMSEYVSVTCISMLNETVTNEIVTLWRYGTVSLWHYITIELWRSDSMTMWHYRAVTLWHCDAVAMWHSGVVTLLRYGVVMLWSVMLSSSSWSRVRTYKKRNNAAAERKSCREEEFYQTRPNRLGCLSR